MPPSSWDFWFAQFIILNPFTEVSIPKIGIILSLLSTLLLTPSIIRHSISCHLSVDSLFVGFSKSTIATLFPSLAIAEYFGLFAKTLGDSEFELRSLLKDAVFAAGIVLPLPAQLLDFKPLRLTEGIRSFLVVLSPGFLEKVVTFLTRLGCR